MNNKLDFKKLIYKSSLFILLIQFSLVGIYIFDHRTRFKNKLSNLRTYIELSFNSLHPRDYLEYFQDMFGSFFYVKQLDRVDLSLSLNDKKKLECLRLRKQDCTKSGWVKAELISKNEIFPIKVRAKGDRSIHRKSLETMSFKIDIRGDKRFKGMEEFSLQSPIIRNYTYEPMAARALKSEGIITPKHIYVRLYINGKYSGVKHIEESFSNELIERSKKRFGPVFSLNEYENISYQDNSFDIHDKKYWMNSNSDLPNKALSVLRSSQKNPYVFNKYFDTEKWAKYFAMMDNLFMYHGILPKSVKFYMNPITGLIEPIFFDGHHVKAIWGDDFRFSDMLFAENRLGNNCRILCGNDYFYKMLLGDEDNINEVFYSDYLKYMDKYSSNTFYESTLKKEWDNLWLERGTIYREFFKRDANEHEGILPHVGSLRNLKKRFKSIRKDIESAKNAFPIHSYSKAKNSIIVENQNSKFPQIYSLFCKDEKFLDKFILVKGKRISSKNLSFYNCNRDSILFSLDDGEKKIPLTNLLLDDYDFKKNIQENLNKSINNKDYVFEKYFDKINKDLLIKNKNVIFNKSSNICLSNNSNLHIINSKVEILGTKENPVSIRGCTKTSKGSIIIEKSIIDIGYLELGNLKAPNFELRNLFGGINIIDSKVNGQQITILDSESEDALNLIDSSITMNNLKFKNILSDAIDMDFSNFDINLIECNSIGNDCIDLSFSKGNINYIYGTNIYDKAVSTGEESSLNIKNIFVDNSEMGIVVKDNSNINIDLYKFSNLKVPIASYIKKNEFGPPMLNIKNIEGQNFSTEFISNDSIVSINDKEILGSNNSKIISEKFYGKIYGVKTKRL